MTTTQPENEPATSKDNDEGLSFDTLGLPETVLKAIVRAGYTTPTPIQAETIPALLDGRDVLGQAATGTGKTAAFALPILAKLAIGSSKPFETQALVLVPTRELALQVTESMKKYSDAMGVTVLAIYGGQDFAVQLRPLKRGVDVVVATPGRAIDHLKRKTLKLDRVKTVVLDEADEMLDMGFAEDLEVLLGALPSERQVALFSATMPSRILKIAERQMKNPVRVSIARAVSHGEGQKIRQVAYVVARKQKVEALLRVLEVEQPTSALVFCRTRADVDELNSVLEEKGLATQALHGGLSQEQRDRVMKKFKSGAVKYVVATDVAARGIHVDNLSHVINADVPTSPEVYVHRIGRTGRAGREGVAITFAEPGEVRLIRGLERTSGGRIQQLPVPSADQVKSKKVKSTQNAVEAAVELGRGVKMRAWVDSLGEQLPAVAAAALELLHSAMHNEPLGAVGTSSEELASPRAETRHRNEAPRLSAPRAKAADRSAAEEPRERPHAGARQEPRVSAPRAKAREAIDVPGSREARAIALQNEASEQASSEAGASAPRHRSKALGEARPVADEARPRRNSSETRAVEEGDGGALPQRRATNRDDAPAKAPRLSAPGHARSGEGRPERPARAPRMSAPSHGRGAEAASHAKHARGGAQANAAPFSRRAETPARDEARGFSRRDDSKGMQTRAGASEPMSRGKPADAVTLFIGAGTQAGIRASDLVGAIANEAGLHSRQIGPIDIRETYSLVGVPKVAANAVIDALQSTKIRGRKVRVNLQKK